MWLKKSWGGCCSTFKYAGENSYNFILLTAPSTIHSIVDMFCFPVIFLNCVLISCLWLSFLFDILKWLLFFGKIILPWDEFLFVCNITYTINMQGNISLLQEFIGWRDRSRKMLLFSTDASFHFAGDGKVFVKINSEFLTMKNYYRQSFYNMCQNQIQIKALKGNIVES